MKTQRGKIIKVVNEAEIVNKRTRNTCCLVVAVDNSFGTLRYTTGYLRGTFEADLIGKNVEITLKRDFTISKFRVLPPLPVFKKRKVKK